MCRLCLRQLLFIVVITTVSAIGLSGCTDTPPMNPPGENTGDNDGVDNDDPGDNSGEDNGDNSTENNDDDNDSEPPCENLECDQVDCGDAEATTLTGTVYIPNGQLPLPNANVYIPNDELDPVPTSVACQRCDEILSGDPLVETTTDYQGNFQLNNVPATDDVPLVIQSGSWRRKVNISTIQPCQQNSISDAEKLRLPRNRDEGDIPSIAITTGGWDALECLAHAIGLDDSEFGVPGDDAAVTIYYNGGSDGFTSQFGGADFPDASTFWNDVSGLEQYSMMLFSCSGGMGNANALQQYADQGGRVFMTDLQKAWLEHGTEDFQSVATWSGGSSWTDEDGHIDTTFAAGQTLQQWMAHVDGLNDAGFIPLKDVVHQIGSVNEDVATRWIYSQPNGGQQEHYFDFHTPVGADEDQQCGRVVYSDLHIVAAGDATASGRFPDNCGTGELSGQEKALLYMLFDLSGCVEPDCAEIDEPCKSDDDCCNPLWCDDNTDTCTDRCRTVGERCSRNSDCCSESCHISAGDEEGQCVIG